MDDYSDWEKSKKEMNRSSFKIWQKAKPIHVIFIAILFFISQKIVQNNKENKFVWVIVAALGILYLYTLTRGEETKNVIPRHIAEQMELQLIQHHILKTKVGMMVRAQNYLNIILDLKLLNLGELQEI